MNIGSFQINGRVFLAPMAGVTDRPFRILCRQNGAALAYSEMISSNPNLQNTRKTILRSDHTGEPEPRIIQILGACPQAMAEAAKFNVAQGAQIIDINMGCPAKKVCNVAAGSALLKDELLVKSILTAVVNSVNVPVTLKIRTGWDRLNRNALIIAKIAESCGIQALTVHGRTRACGFSGSAEYTTIADVKTAVKIPVIANGDIDSPEKAKFVLDNTGADALMIGRASLGKPWLFGQIQHFLNTGVMLLPPNLNELQTMMLNHLNDLYAFYGDYSGLRIARKHIGWYVKNLDENSLRLISSIYSAQTVDHQLRLVKSLFTSN